MTPLLESSTRLVALLSTTVPSAALMLTVWLFALSSRPGPSPIAESALGGVTPGVTPVLSGLGAHEAVGNRA
jgi:hypothetical protein